MFKTKTSRLILLFSLVFPGVLFSGCRNEIAQGNNGNGAVEKPSATQTPADHSEKRFQTPIDGIGGVVVLSEDYSEEDPVRIYEKNGRVWYEFAYEDEAIFDDLEGLNTEFRPAAFHPDYLLVVMRAVAEDDKTYEVVVNEEKGITKYVRKDDKALMFERYEDHILTTFAVDFDDKKNPIRSEPDGETVEVDMSAIPIFRAEKVEGDWLRVNWEKSLEPENKKKENKSAAAGEKKKTGWIRWRVDGVMLIDLFYFA